jgi:hypothetical protein
VARRADSCSLTFPLHGTAYDEDGENGSASARAAKS